MKRKEPIHYTDLVRTGGTQAVLPDEFISEQVEGLIRVDGKHPSGRLNVSLTEKGYEVALSLPQVEAEVLARFTPPGVRRIYCHEQTLIDLLQRRGLLFVSTYGNSDFPIRMLSSQGERRLALLKQEISLL